MSDRLKKPKDYRRSPPQVQCHGLANDLAMLDRLAETDMKAVEQMRGKAEAERQIREVREQTTLVYAIAEDLWERMTTIEGQAQEAGQVHQDADVERDMWVNQVAELVTRHINA